MENRLGSTALHEQISPGEYMSYKLDAAGPTSIKVTFKDSQGMNSFIFGISNMNQTEVKAKTMTRRRLLKLILDQKK